jgi:hypothetical protein
MQALDRKLDAVLAGTEKLQAAEALDLADVCARGRGKPVAAARLLVTFFAGQPMMATDPTRGLYLRAAQVAVLAAAERGADARRWRRQALTWLDREVDTWERLVREGARSEAEKTRALRSWWAMPSLAPVRDEAALAELPADEAAAWRGLWRRVEKPAGR